VSTDISRTGATIFIRDSPIHRGIQVCEIPFFVAWHSASNPGGAGLSDDFAVAPQGWRFKHGR
jgi:hypothetical protein